MRDNLLDSGSLDWVPMLASGEATGDGAVGTGALSWHAVSNTRRAEATASKGWDMILEALIFLTPQKKVIKSDKTSRRDGFAKG